MIGDFMQDQEIIMDIEDLRKAVDDLNIYFTQKIKDLSDKISELDELLNKYSLPECALNRSFLLLIQGCTVQCDLQKCR